MKKKIVLFGTGKIADVIHYQMTHDGDFEVAAATVDREYITTDHFHGAPVVPFEEIQEKYPPSEYGMFVALGYQSMNDLRAAKVATARGMGYELVTFVHPESGMPACTELGDNCFVMNNVAIQPWVTLGHNVFVFSGAMIGHHSSVGDNCWVTSTANISGVVTAGQNCFFATSSTVAHEVTLGDRCFLGANSLVTKDLADGSVVIQKSTDVQRLNSDQFLKLSRFT